jgi:hypothetical protein
MSDRAVPAEVRLLAIDRATRRRIGRSVRTGAPVSNPHEAALAAGYCSASLDWLSQRGRLRPFKLVIALMLVVELAIAHIAPVNPLLAAAAGFGFLRLRAPTRRRRLSAGLEANGKVAEGSGLEPVGVRLPGYAWLWPGRRRRWLVRVLASALVLFLYVAIMANFFVRTTGT